MAEQCVSTNSTTDNEQSNLYFPQALFRTLGDLNRINCKAVSVMLSLISGVGGNGAVQTTQAAVAQQCKISLKAVAKAIADLEDAGLIGSVHASSQPGGVLACVVNVDLARLEKPDETSLSPVVESVWSMSRRDEVVKVPAYTIEALAAYVPLGEDCVGLMLLLLMKMDRDRVVRIDMDLLPHYYTIRRDRLDYAVSGLIDHGWVHSVDQEALQEGFLSCVVHSVFVDSDFKTLIGFFHPLLPNTCKRIEGLLSFE